MTPGYVLQLSADRRRVFEDCIREGRSFGQPVPMFSYNRNFPFLTLISTRHQTISYIARGGGGNTAGTGLRRLNLDDVYEIDMELDEIIEEASNRYKKQIQKSWDQGGILPDKTFKELLRCIYNLVPNLESTFGKYLNKPQSLRKLGKGTLQSLGEQKEAVATALFFADIDRKPLQTWSTSEKEKPGSFLDGLDSVYRLEDTMIYADMLDLPGFDRIQEMSFGAARFEGKSSGVLLDVIVANKTTLEHQTGADLIYYNEAFQSFVFVQYKAMEREPGSGNLFRFPNAQLAKEIETMRALLTHIGPADPKHRSQFRFMYNPFYIKLCPRISFNPLEVKLSSGMYFNLDHWDILEKDDDLIGPKGGRRVLYNAEKRHINNSEFAALVHNSWIGTTPAQSTLIEPLIEEIIRTGKSLIYAIKRHGEVVENHLDHKYDRNHDDEPPY